MTEIIILILFIFILLLFLAIFSIFSLYIFDLFLPAPFVSTKREAAKKMVEAAQIKTGDKVVDLGSGDGRLVIEAAKAGAQALGVEKNPLLVLLSKSKIWLAKVNAQVFWQDILDFDLQGTDIVFLYLNSKMLTKLSPKFKKELKKGAKIVSNTYEISNFTLYKKFDNILLYIIGAKH